MKPPKKPAFKKPSKGKPSKGKPSKGSKPSKPSKPPKGFNPIKRKPTYPPIKGKALIETASASIQAEIEGMFRNVEAKIDKPTTYTIHVNKDKSIDSELRIFVDLKPLQLIAPLLKLEKLTWPIKTCWLAFGFALPPGPSEHKTGVLISRGSGQPIRGGKGAYFVMTYYFDMGGRTAKGARGFETAFLTARTVVRTLAKRKIRLVEYISMRINWNPEMVRPTRIG